MHTKIAFLKEYLRYKNDNRKKLLLLAHLTIWLEYMESQNQTQFCSWDISLFLWPNDYIYKKTEIYEELRLICILNCLVTSEETEGCVAIGIITRH